jgi:outer membrane protein OmpA-like peptidoglycan-associated protein
MKTLATLLAFLLFSSNALPQTSAEPENFVIVGTFRNLDNAERFIIDVNRNGFDAQCAVRSSMELYYVYVLHTPNKTDAQDLLNKIKAETDFKSAWIFHGNFDPERKPISTSISGYLIDRMNEDQGESKLYYFKVASVGDGKEIPGNLLIQETDGSSPVWVKSGDLVYLKKPQNSHQSFRVIAMFPGYRQGSIVCFYNQPPIEIGFNNENIVTLALEKARGKNFIDFSNVRFLGNSSFLRTVSEHEMNDFVSFLKANPNEKIIIHCHSSEKQEQEFASNQRMLETSNFKSLALARAESVKSYLMQRGIDSSRIFTRGEEILPEAEESFKHYLNTIEIEFVKGGTENTF